MKVSTSAPSSSAPRPAGSGASGWRSRGRPRSWPSTRWGRHCGRPRPAAVARRALLEEVMAVVAPPLQLTPQTRDHATAVQWLADYRRAAVGIEGLVAKGRGDPYQPSRRGWGKGSSATLRRRWPVPSSALSSGHAGWCSSASSAETCAAAGPRPNCPEAAERAHRPAYRCRHVPPMARRARAGLGWLTGPGRSRAGTAAAGGGGTGGHGRRRRPVAARPRFVRARPDLSTGNG